jgi:hypothetical protein
MEDMEYKDYKLANGNPFSDDTLFVRHYLDDDTWFAHKKDSIKFLADSKMYNNIVKRGWWVEC